MKRNITALLIIALIVSVFLYTSGYRLDGVSAARANAHVPKDSVLLDQVDYDWGTVYIFHSAEKPITAISMKKLAFLWVSRTSVYYFHQEDPIRTIGGVSMANEREKATVLSVIVHDPEVTSLEVGLGAQLQRKPVIVGEPVTFSWTESISWNDLNPKALNNDGKTLYEYRYANSHHIRAVDLRWYPLGEGLQSNN
ncbi:hypothetical protein DUZ99_19600 [Xylanibacillus composti]|uniref:Uncharacterized protein n=1 Tax=Xylanibacillus composti TaxID=1572762 RepID=A0A8J4H635_9BACL|nr:hypothetical protein [Xylanibacillus composti]MDT9727171.1 hypothetical protein [Xylanibacillus composti]GIQ70406.1 hypothetical protein XYCOK13_32300 [Xylanibacillus composti]